MKVLSSEFHLRVTVGWKDLSSRLGLENYISPTMGKEPPSFS